MHAVSREPGQNGTYITQHHVCNCAVLLCVSMCKKHWLVEPGNEAIVQCHVLLIPFLGLQIGSCTDAVC